MKPDHPSDFFDVRIFHKKFGQPIDRPSADGLSVERPTLLPADQYAFRRKFLFEEFDEYSVAYNKGNLIKAADALFDLVYVIFGTALFMRAGPTYWEGSWPNGAWPTAARVFSHAKSIGVLAARTPFPRLLTSDEHNLQHEQIGSWLRQFHQAHHLAQPNAVPYALSCLWNAAYSTYLTGELMSVPWERCWTHVQAANMEKIRAQPDGSDSLRGSGWDVVKPKGWCAPDALIAHELTMAGASIPSEFLDEAVATSQPKA